jgi:hypothetical protein
MRLKIRDARNLAAAIGAIQAMGRPAPALFGFNLALNIKALGPTLEAFEASRQELLTRFGDKDEAGKRVEIDGEVQFSGDNRAEFERVLGEVLKGEVSLNLQTLPFDLLPSEIEPGLLAGIMPIIEAPGAKPAADDNRPPRPVRAA